MTMVNPGLKGLRVRPQKLMSTALKGYNTYQQLRVDYSDHVEVEGVKSFWSV